MKAVRFRAFGVPHHVAECVEVPDVGAPGAGEALVAVEASPINPVDLLTMEGRYAVRPALPAAAGSEAVGSVVAVGPGVEHVAVGDRVMLLGRDNWAEQRKVPASELLPVPGGDILQLAMLKINPATAALMLQGYVALEPGEWVVQDAANSAVGRHVIALAQRAGLRTANVVRRHSAAAGLESAGADAVFVDGEELASRVETETGGAAIRLALDAVGGDVCIRLADCLAEGGTVVSYGLLSGQPCMLRPEQTVFRGITLTGFWLVRELGKTSRDRLLALYQELGALVADGTLHVEVEATYPLEQIGRALEHAARPGRRGKILLTPGTGPG